MRFAIALFGLLIGQAAAQAVTIATVPVGNPDNAGEAQADGIFGRVTISYRIGKTEVTNAQYVDFLNAKGATDPYQLYSTNMGFSVQGGIARSGSFGSYTYAVKPNVPDGGPGGSVYTYGDKPVVFVSWYDAIRFANWMHNGQGPGDTETGAYTLLGGTTIPSMADSIARNAGAKWFLPTENEWYKAAYYDGANSIYYDYPTGTDTVPNNNLPSADNGNSANFFGSGSTTGNLDYPFTVAGAYTQSESPYGTFDQGGSVAEWSQTLFSAGTRVRRGGSWSLNSSYLSSANRASAIATSELQNIGFRLATLPSVPGDYNANGVVDGADYVVWRDHVGQMFQLPNEVAGKTPGQVTPEDYDAWRERFGATAGSASGSGAQSAPVPEPGTWVLSLVAIVALGRRTRRMLRL